jgi:hypothetical protein
MRRDMDLIREILMATEANRDIDTNGFSAEEVWNHVRLLKQAGYIDALVAAHQPPYPFQIFALTWDGHEFLDAMRDDTLWKKAKETFLKPGASWTAKLLFEWLKVEIKQRFIGGNPS